MPFEKPRRAPPVWLADAVRMVPLDLHFVLPTAKREEVRVCVVLAVSRCRMFSKELSRGLNPKRVRGKSRLRSADAEARFEIPAATPPAGTGVRSNRRTAGYGPVCPVVCTLHDSQRETLFSVDRFLPVGVRAGLKTPWMPKIAS